MTQSQTQPEEATVPALTQAPLQTFGAIRDTRSDFFGYQNLTVKQFAARINVPTSWVLENSNPAVCDDPIPHLALGKRKRFQWAAHSLPPGLNDALSARSRLELLKRQLLNTSTSTALNLPCVSTSPNHGYATKFAHALPNQFPTSVSESMYAFVGAAKSWKPGQKVVCFLRTTGR